MNVIRNERMGTAYGDQIIRGVAECIRASLRTGEQVYRIMYDGMPPEVKNTEGAFFLP